MKRNDAFPSPWLKEPDLQGRPCNVVITRCERKEVGRKGDVMPILYFQGKVKGLGLNKTNWDAVESLWGRESDNWIGKAIQLYPTTCQFEADPNYPCLRIRAVPATVQAPAAELPPPEALPEPEADDSNLDDSSLPADFPF